MASNLSKPERIAKRDEAWRLAAAGSSQATIAARLGVNQSTVSRWLAQLGRAVVARMEDEAASAFVAALRHIDRAIEESWLAFDRSKAPAKRMSGKRTPGKPGAPTAAGGDAMTVETTERDGDGTHLDRIVRFNQARLDMLNAARWFAPPEASGAAAPTGVDLASAVLQAARERDAAYQPDPDDDEAPSDAA